MSNMIKPLTKWLVSQAKILVAIVVTAIVASGSALVFASIPDANGVITACRTNLTGAVRIIDTASQSCNGLETAITWKQKAPGMVLDLTGADFAEADLRYRDFTDMDLTNADFTSGKISGADFGNANLTGADFT